jgi:hypothetical protein
MIDSISASVNQAISGRVLTSDEKAKNTQTPPELQPMQPMQALPKSP